MILLRIICMQLISLNKPSSLISLTDMNFSMRQIILNQINWIHVQMQWTSLEDWCHLGPGAVEEVLNYYLPNECRGVVFLWNCIFLKLNLLKGNYFYSFCM